MAQFPALPLFTDAYLADTGHLTTIEHGAYLLLLMAMWRTKDCCLPNDDKLLARYARLTAGQWKRIKPVIFDFFDVSSDSITQGRLTDEREFVRQKSSSQSEKAKARWLKNNKTDDAAAIPDECPTDAPTPTPTPTIKKDKDKSLSQKVEPPPDENSEEVDQQPGPQPVQTTDDLTNIPGFLKREPDQTFAAVAAWNEMAEEFGLAKVQKLTDSRKTKLKARLKDCGGLAGWNAALGKVRASPGLLGRVGDSWKADFDFLLQESSFVKLMEGKYDGWTEKNRRGGEPASVVEACKRAADVVGNRAPGGVRY